MRRWLATHAPENGARLDYQCLFGASCGRFVRVVAGSCLRGGNERHWGSITREDGGTFGEGGPIPKRGPFVAAVRSVGQSSFHASFRGGFRSTWRKLHSTTMPTPVSPWTTIWAQLRGPSGAAKKMLSSKTACPAVVSKSHRLPFGKIQSMARPSRTRFRRTFGWM